MKITFTKDKDKEDYRVQQKIPPIRDSTVNTQQSLVFLKSVSILREQGVTILTSNFEDTYINKALQISGSVKQSACTAAYLEFKPLKPYLLY